VKRLLALLAGGLGLGGLGLGALLRRRRRPPAPAPKADELRAKLAASRADAPPAAPAPVVPPADDVDARRAEVHERARRALGELDQPSDA
jgi:hypothetical protein